MDLNRNFFKDSSAHGQMMIDPLVWQTRISPRIFLKIQHVYGQKMIDPPRMTDQDLTYAHGQKMIDPLRGSLLRIFFKDSTCVWSKMIDP